MMWCESLPLLYLFNENVSSVHHQCDIEGRFELKMLQGSNFSGASLLSILNSSGYWILSDDSLRVVS